MSDDIVTRLREAGECPTPLRAYLARAVVLQAADEIERLRADVMCLKYQNAEFVRNLTMAQDERNAAVSERDEARREVCAARKERDEATRLLYVMVEHLYGITPIDKNPKHDCGFDHRPDLGSCKFCENWTAANVILYGEEYAND